MCKKYMSGLNAKISAAEAAEVIGLSITTIHKYVRERKIKPSKSNNKICFTHTSARKLFRFKFTPKIISFQIVKGGTGKTSLAHSLAIRANLYGARVLCVDLDQQGNLSQAFNVDADQLPVMVDVIKENLNISEAIHSIAPGLDIIPSRIDNATLDNVLMLEKHSLDRVYSNMLRPLLSKYDLIIIDCPPALGQSVAAATLSSDLIISPLTPEQFSVSGLKISYDEISDLARKYGKKIDFKIVLNKFDARTALSGEVLTNLLSQPDFKHMLCRSFIRACQEFPNAIYTKSNIFETLKKTAAKEDIDLFTSEILCIKKAKKETMAA